MNITGHYRTNPIDFGEYHMNSFFTGVEKRILTHYRILEPNYLKRSSIQTAHSIELKFGMRVIVHRLIYCIDFGEFSNNSFFFFFMSTKKNSYTLRPMESNSLKCSSIQMIHSIDLKFGMDIIDHRSANYIDFGE